jgi:uncharacterized protein (TIGR03435 family)
VSATFNGEPSLSDVRLMMRTLLAERFRLRTHVERREMPIYRLVFNRQDRQIGSQMQPLPDVDCEAVRNRTGGPPPDWKDGPPPCLASAMFGAVSEIRSGGSTLRELASSIEDQLDRRVQQQLGLKLQSSRELLDVLVIDSIDRPTPD